MSDCQWGTTGERIELKDAHADRQSPTHDVTKQARAQRLIVQPARLIFENTAYSILTEDRPKILCVFHVLAREILPCTSRRTKEYYRSIRPNRSKKR